MPGSRWGSRAWRSPSAPIQAAVAHAAARVQGRPPVGAAIIEHPDVRRMLMTMRGPHRGDARAVAICNAGCLDTARRSSDADERERAAERADLLTPLGKAWCTDVANERRRPPSRSTAGWGTWRRPELPSTTGTSGSPPSTRAPTASRPSTWWAASWLERDGAVVAELFSEIRGTIAQLPEPLADVAESLAAALEGLEELTAWMREQWRDARVDALAGATPFLRMFATTVAGWLMARQAVVAFDRHDDYHAAELTTARFFCTQVLPQVRGLAPTVRRSRTSLRSAGRAVGQPLSTWAIGPFVAGRSPLPQVPLWFEPI